MSERDYRDEETIDRERDHARPVRSSEEADAVGSPAEEADAVGSKETPDATGGDGENSADAVG